MSLRSTLNGTFTPAELDRLAFPVAWDGTKDRDEAAQEESELRSFVRDAKEQLQAAHDASESDSAEFSVKVEDGEIVGFEES